MASPRITVDMMAEVAVQIERQKSYPAEVLVTQWAIESGNGLHQAGDYNFWGVTAPHGDDTNSTWCTTHEVLTPAQIDQEEKAGVFRNIVLIEHSTLGRNVYQLQRRFRKYPSLMAGAMDQVNLLTESALYKPAFKRFTLSHDYVQFIRDIAKDGYASAPNYAEILIKEAKSPNIIAAIKKARETTPSQVPPPSV
jgi:flagellum-specific peptidoglycan hydrolase FlgJ